MATLAKTFCSLGHSPGRARSAGAILVVPVPDLADLGLNGPQDRADAVQVDLVLERERTVPIGTPRGRELDLLGLLCFVTHRVIIQAVVPEPKLCPLGFQ